MGRGRNVLGDVGRPLHNPTILVKIYKGVGDVGTLQGRRGRWHFVTYYTVNPTTSNEVGDVGTLSLNFSLGQLLSHSPASFKALSATFLLNRNPCL